MKFATNIIQQYPPHLRRVATLPWELKNSNFWPPVNQFLCPATFLAAYYHQALSNVSQEICLSTPLLCTPSNTNFFFI